MLFNRHGLQQKNWRMVKKGKHILFGCSLFFVVGGMSISGSQVANASETNASRVVEEKVVANNTNSEISEIKASTLEKEQVSEASNDKKAEKIKQTQDVEKPAEKNEKKENLIGEKGEKPLVKKEVNKKELKDLVDKIKKADISGKTEKSVKELNLVLSRAEKALDNKEITQEEIDKEVKLLKVVFENLEDKPREDKKSEIKEKDDKSSSEKDIKEKQQENNTEDIARRHNEKITKATNIVKEINSLANEINYEFSDSEKELVNTIEKLLTTDDNSEESIQKLLNEAIYLRNRVANRVTRANSGRRDPRNGKVIDKNGESRFRGVVYTHKENRRNGNLIENGSTAVYYNSDEIWSLVEIKGERVGNERKFTTYVRGRIVEDVTPYYIVTVGFTGNSPIKGLKMQVAYWDKQAGKAKGREIEQGRTEINNPITNAAIRGVVGEGAIVQPGRYEVHIASNTRVAPNQLKPYTFTFIIKPQSERNTVKDLSQTYVDDVRHLTENEKTALIEKFKTEHPDVMKPSGHKSDFDHAEVSADGTTMTIHFKDGFNPKTIQTNATNNVEAKHSSLTAYFGDNKELYTNPRQLVRSKTGNEVPSTAQVTYKTPFNLQQVGTRNVVVTTTYENGVTKDITTPYTVLDFTGKQDKKINQNQSGQLGDARNYITVSDNSALPSEFTVRWKGGSSTVDTSAAGVQHKEIEILRGNHLMKTVRIPVEIVDNINPTITAPDSVLLTRLEGLPSEINISAQDNNKGVGLKDGNPITVENLPNPLFYNPKTSKIEINGVIPNNFQNGKSSIQVPVKAVDRKGNTATKNITFNIQSQTQKYTAVANPKIQEVSHAQTPDPGTSISTTGLPANTQYKWERKPDTNTPGNKDGVVKVTYPDGSTDIVNVTVKVRKLSDEHEPTGTKIVKSQNDSVSNNDLKAAVTINNNGNSKVKSVTSLGNISTTNAGTQTINATVTYLDGTTDPVTIPLEVKDITAPTIQTPTDRQNWDLIALDRTLPSIKLTSEDNTGGTGIKSTTVTGLPDFLVYDNATKTIKFKNGVQEVTKLPDGQDSKTYNVNIQVMDNSNNSSRRQVTITVKSMTTKYSATANPQKQTVSYGQTPNAETSINKNGLPAGTTYTWRTIPNTTTGPGQKAGVVIVTYPDGSTDLVDVTVDVRKLSDEYEPTGTKIVKNQNATVTNADLKAAVTISNNGNSKVKSVTPVGNISTTNAGTQTINATVTYLDDTTDSVTIPLEVKDVIAPTIQTPTEGQLWEITSLDKTLPSIRVETSDNSGGSGVKSIVPINLPSFLKFDKATNSIVFQDGVREVPKLSGINRTTKTVTLRVEDNAGNSSERTFQIRQISMAEKYNPQANTTIQEVSHGEIPNPKTSINTAGLPVGVQYTWKSTPDTSKPGDKTGVVTVTYPDDSIDEVNVTVKVRKLSDEYEPTATKIVKNQNDLVSNDELKAAVTISNNGASKVKSVTPVDEISTTKFGNKTINATVTYLDDTTDTVTIPLEVKDVTPPTIQTPTENINWEITALDKTLPNMEVRAEDNANGSGVKTVSVEGLPDYLEYDSATNSIKFKAGKQEVEKLPENTPSKEFNLNIHVEDNAGNVSEIAVKITVSSISTKTNPQPENQTVNYGQTPNPEDSVNKQGLPDGTTVTWKTPPVVNTPGSTTGEVEITYPDGSKDVITVNVTVRKVSEEFTATGTQIEVNQNEEVTSDMLKGAVNATNAQGENGNAKIAKVESKSPINTATYGNQTIQAKVTYIDGSEQDVTIPLNVKDVTDPTILTPEENKNWEIAALDKTLPVMKIKAEDNANGSGISTIEVRNMPSFLAFDESTGTIVFKEGIQEVPKIKSDNTMYGVTIIARDKAGNSTSILVNITVWSMRGKYNPQPKPQTVDNGTVPNAEDSVDKTGLPEGTTVTWKINPDVSTPGSHPTVALVTYPDGTVDEVEVPITVKEQKDTFNPTAKQPGQTAKHGSNPSAEGSINTDGLPSGTTYTWVEKPDTNTTPGSKPGKVLITYPDNSTEEVTVTVEVTPQKDDYNPQPKPQTVDNGTVPNAEDSVDKTGLPEGTTVTWKTNPDVSTPGSHPTVALVTYPDGTVDEVEVPITVKKQSETFTPTAKEPNQTAKHGSNPSTEGSINTDGLPSGTTYTWVEKPDTHTMPGSKPGKVLITYPDNSTEEVTVTVEVTPQKDDYNPQPKPQTVDNGTVPNAEDSVDKTGLPEGTTVTWKTNPDVSTPGAHPTIALVTYPDGTVDEVEVPITVKKQSDTFTPTAKEPNPTAKHGSDPSAEGSINTDGLPSGTTYTWVEKPDTNTTPGSKPGKVLITYPDNSTEEVPVTVEVTPQKDDYNPQPKLQTVDNGTVPNAEDSVDKTGLPSGTTIAWKTNPEVTTPGEYLTIALVTYPDGTVDEVTVPITVKKQSETFTPTAKQPNQTAKHGSDPSAEGSINTDSLPSGTTYTWVEKPDTNTTPGSKQGKVLITYPDNSTEEVTVTVEVTPQKDDYNPQPKPQTITNGDVPNAKDSIGNVQELPDGTRIEWKDGTVPNTDTPGNISAKITITYPDGTADEVDVTIIANKQTAKGDPEVQPTLPEFSGGVNGDPEVQPALPEFNGGVNGDPEVQPDLPEFNGGVNGDPEVQPMLPEFNGGVDGDPEVQPMLPEFSGGVNGDPEVQPALPEFNGGVNGDPEVQPMLPEFNGGVNGDPEVQPTLPEFNGGVNGEPEVQPTLPEFNGGVNGDPEVQPTLPEFNGGVNGDPEVQSTLPEFNGGVNGDPEVQPTLPEFNGGVNGDPETQPEIQKNKLIITRWIDENGNELKPVDAKASTKLGEENKAFDHGEIEGYEFIRTEVSKSGDVVTHIFRKRANNVINKVRVTQANSRNIDLVKSSGFSKTYKRLANTGETANNSELAGLGLAIVGLFAAIKRRKNEED